MYEDHDILWGGCRVGTDASAGVLQQVCQLVVHLGLTGLSKVGPYWGQQLADVALEGDHACHQLKHVIGFALLCFPATQTRPM